MSQFSEHYMLNIFAYFATKHTRDTFKVTIHSDYGQALYNVTRNGTCIARGLTEQQVRQLLIKYVPPEMVQHPSKPTRKTGK